MQAGTVQKYTEQKRQTSGGSMHYSKQYKEAKANNFKRKTTGNANLTSIKGKKDLYFRGLVCKRVWEVHLWVQRIYRKTY